MCGQLETTTIVDQLEAVRWEHNHSPKEKLQATGAGFSGKRECQQDEYQYGILLYTMISEYLDAIGCLTGL